MENEEIKNNEIVEEAVPTEETIQTEETVPTEEAVPTDETQAEEPELEEYVEQRYDEEPIEVEAPVSVEEPVAEDIPAEEESVSEETPVEEESAEEVVPVEEQSTSEETLVEDPVPEDTPVEEESAPAEEPTAEEVAPVEEAVSEETDAEEESAPEETPAEEESASEETPEGEESAPAEEPTAEEELVFEEVVLIDEEPKEPEIVVEELTEELLEEVAAEETIADEPVEEPEIIEPQPESSEPEQEPLTETVAEEPETAEASEPQPEPQKKGLGGTVLKVIGLVVILLLIFVPAGLSLWKGEPFRKELINYKRGLSRTYESYYRKEIFPKLSAAFVPEWAKQMKIEEEKRAAEEAKRKEEEAKKAEEDKKKDILYGVPQVPDGLEYFPLYIEDHMVVFGRDDWLYTAEGTSLDYYAGTNVLSEEEMAAYAKLLDTLNDICKAKGIELVMEVAPNKEQVYPEHYPSYTIENQKKRLLVMEEYMREYCSVPFVYPIRELAANKDQYDTYWKYDTHWNSTGAFIGMKAIYEALGRQVNDKDATMRKEDTNRGDLAGVTGYTDLYTDYITEYKPAITVGRESYYDYEYDIDDYGVRYISTADNERKLVVVGDSYRVSLAAQMCKDYKYTDAIHRDILGTDVAAARLRELSEGDTLVIICIERWDYRMFDAIPSIIAIMQES